jgi:type I restriction enzyme S subunit
MKKFLDCISVVGTTPSRFQGKRKYVSTGAVATTEINESEVVEVTYEDRPSRANLSAESGDILFAKMQGTRKTLLLDSETEENIYSTGFYAVRANPNVITTECLYYLIDSELFLTQKDKHCSGATQKAITNGGLAKIEIRVPPLSEQGILTVKLRYLTQLIVDKRKQLELLDEVIKSRFIEMFGDPTTNEKGWTVSALGEYMTLLTDFSANGSYELLDSNVVMYDEPNYAVMVRTTDLEAGDLTNGVKYIDQAAYELLSKSKLFGGELIMNKIGSAGKIYIMPQIDKPASLGRNAFMFRFDDRINMTYLYALLSSDYGTNEIQQYVRGAVTKTITKESTRSIRVFVPPIELQTQFATFVEQIDKSKFEIQQSLEKLEILKKSLMQQYFG